ncbi:hypothetical protein [Ewingella americana]|uniref:Uncharacterized protein n=1 Tax=Ewingella americana TaxID=41202 RepID=A0A502GDM1_9GAMM|nr:hypothetical protein [Ewingella americana]TPG60015.1 hypothetical protein EAH77_15725 [Ewingella americana]
MSSETENGQPSNEDDSSADGMLKKLTSSFAARLIFTVVIAIAALTAEKITGISSEAKEKVEVSEVAHAEIITGGQVKEIYQRLDDLTNDFKRLDGQTMTVKDGLKIQYQLYRLQTDIEILKSQQSALETHSVAGARAPVVQKRSENPKRIAKEPTLSFSEFEIQMLNGTLGDEKDIN